MGMLEELFGSETGGPKLLFLGTVAVVTRCPVEVIKPAAGATTPEVSLASPARYERIGGRLKLLVAVRTRLFEGQTAARAELVLIVRHGFGALRTSLRHRGWFLAGEAKPSAIGIPYETTRKRAPARVPYFRILSFSVCPLRRCLVKL